MASNAHTTGERSRAPGNPDDVSRPSRRGLILAAGAIGAGAAMAPAGMAVPLNSPNSSLPPEAARWKRLLERYRSLKAASDLYRDQVYRPLDDHHPKHPSLRFSNGQHANPAELVRGRCSPMWPRPEFDVLRERWLAYTQARDAYVARTGIDAIADECDRLATLWIEAQAELLLAPAPDLRALAFKVAIIADDVELWEYEGTDTGVKVRAAMKADAARLGKNV